MWGDSVRPEDQLAIANLAARYCDAVNAADAAAWAGTWAPSCRWQPGPDRVLEGREAVVAFWRTAMASFESVVQIAGHGQVRADGDGAAGTWTLVEVSRRGDANGLLVGQYRDRYVQTAGAWLFAERRFTVLFRGSLPDGDFADPRSLTGPDR